MTAADSLSRSARIASAKWFLSRGGFIALAVVAVGVGVAVAFAYCRPEPTPIPRAEQFSIDSAKATRPAFDSTRRTSIRIESVYVAQSARNRLGATTAMHAADSLRGLAIAWQRAAEARGDTVSHWHDVAILRGIENDSLRSANGGLLSALEDETKARTAADSRVSLDSSRLAATENLNARLAVDLRAADPPCRVLVIARCPSRKVVAVGAIALGILAQIEFTRRR
jgi:hypothetical protein